MKKEARSRGSDDGWTTPESTRRLQAYREWMQVVLPALNRAVTDWPNQVSILVAEARAKIEQLIRDVDGWGSLGPAEARAVIQLVGFLASSVEHHTQLAGEAPGAGLARLSGAEALLLRMSIPAGHLPRDSHRTLWLENKGKRPLSFTGDPQELFFHRSVLEVNRLNTESAALLRPLCTGEMDILSDEAVSALTISAHVMGELKDAYHSFFEPDAVGRRPMTPDFFAREFRTYLVRYPVGGEIRTGPNAANVVSQPIHDTYLGTVDPWYLGVIKSRIPHLVGEERAALEEALSLPSVAERLIASIGLAPERFHSLSAAEIDARIAAGRPIVRRVGNAFVAAYRGAGKASATHFSLISNYLIKQMKEMTPEASGPLPVKPTEGTGGMGHGDTRRIMELRQHHPVLDRLAAGFERLAA